MRYATLNTKYACGVDLHGNTIFACVMRIDGTIVLHKEVPSDGKQFLALIKPYLGDITVCAESTFNWYWLADVFDANSIPFV